MELLVREEKQADYDAVYDLIETAFKESELSDHQEQFLVQRLRKSKSFVPELSLVAEFDNKIVGHVLLTRIKIINDKKKFESLALAPLTVLPEYQNRGIGGMLIEKAHQVARGLGYTSVILLGHENYYPRFGYVPADRFGIKLTFEVPAENFLAIELVENGLEGVSGTVEYAKEFNI